jgi:UDP-N-acetylglucosamine acyltransferase
MPIHPTAVVDRRAEISPTADIGPYTIIDGPVRVGDGARVYWHATVTGNTVIGNNCQIHPYAVVGHLPQDLSYTGAETFCEIGDETVIRECASVHRGTAPGSKTIVGKRCFIMACAHVGHNCVVGEDVKIVNAALLAGHVEVGNAAFISGAAAMHQFCRIGELAMVGGQARIRMDVPPFFTVVHFGTCSGINVVGLRRAGFSSEERNELRRVYHLLYREGLLFSKAVEQAAKVVQTAPGRRLVEFLQAPSRRGICGAREKHAADQADD